jgi:phenylacetate-CoA ligase
LRLPLLSKEEIRSSTDDMLWHAAPGGLFRSNTGGSAGDPLIFYFDRRRQGYDQAARIRSRRWFDVDIGDREMYLWGSPIELARTDSVKRMRDALFNHRLLNAFNMSPRRMDEYLEEWDRFRPACLFGYPSSINLLVDHATSRGRKLALGKLKAVFVTGEVCYPHQRETIGSYFGVPVANGYGSREGGFIAHECPEGGMHITAESVIVEIVDTGGTPLPVGETGEIVVTHLDAYAMPFIRYRTGDVGRLKPGRCTCGRGLPLMDVVQGRATDFLYLPDGDIKHALSIIYPLREIAGVRQFRVVQHEDYSVTVDVVADDRGERITHEAVAQRVRPIVGEDAGLRVELVDRIASADSGKHRYVVSHVQPAPGCSRRAMNAPG